jgi:hypothetical protein
MSIWVIPTGVMGAAFGGENLALIVFEIVA